MAVVVVTERPTDAHVFPMGHRPVPLASVEVAVAVLVDWSLQNHGRELREGMGALLFERLGSNLKISQITRTAVGQAMRDIGLATEELVGPPTRRGAPIPRLAAAEITGVLATWDGQEHGPIDSPALSEKASKRSVALSAADTGRLIATLRVASEVERYSDRAPLRSQSSLLALLWLVALEREGMGS